MDKNMDIFYGKMNQMTSKRQYINGIAILGEWDGFAILH